MSTLTHSQAPLNPPAPPPPRTADSRAALARLLRLHLASRRLPAALAALAACAPLMQWALRVTLGQSNNSGTQTAARQLALLLGTAAAAVVSAAMHGPFGESERIAGRWLPWLRLATALLLTATALAALSLGALAAGLPGGELGLLRDSAGLIGLGVLCTVLVGGHFAWIGPAGYFVLAAYAVSDRWTSPWTWPARPATDTGAGLCAIGLLTIAILAIAIIGPRERARE